MPVDEVAKRVYRADLYLEAARALVDEGPGRRG
jgi:hypothetical protein